MTDAYLIPTEAERLVIGQILTDHRLMTGAAQFLKPEHFGDKSCREAYEAALAVWRDGRGVDLVTVAHEIRKKQEHFDPAVFAMLAEFTRPVAQTIHFPYHAEIIREHYASRVLMDAGRSLIDGTAKGSDPLELIAPANEALSRAVMADESTDVDAGLLAADLMNTSARPKPMYLGMANLDGIVWMLPGNVVTVRAEAGVGKTAFVLSAVLNLLPILKTWIVSLEMPAAELVMRALCQIAQVDIDRAMLGHMDEAERERLGRAAIDNADTLSRMTIDDSGGMSTDEFLAKAEHRVKEGVGLIVIDYAQLMSADKKLYPNQVSELEAISKCIRSTARKLSVPILCVVHINKAGEDHGTSQFEKDAHVRLHLSRDKGADMMSVEVLKNRNGRPGREEVPCRMQWGCVGRITPPYWASAPKTFNPALPPTVKADPDAFITPLKDEAAPF